MSTLDVTEPATIWYLKTYMFVYCTQITPVFTAKKINSEAYLGVPPGVTFPNNRAETQAYVIAVAAKIRPDCVMGLSGKVKYTPPGTNGFMIFENKIRCYETSTIPDPATGVRPNELVAECKIID